MIDLNSLTAPWGTIAGALITACVAALGLVISKEHKVSEFRQKWIDDMREDVAKIIAHANIIRAIFSSFRMAKATPKDFMEAGREDGVELNLAITRIQLRLNNKGQVNKKLLQAINDLEKYLEDGFFDNDVETFKAKEDAIRKAASKLLEAEWKRVKRGEPFFMFLKYVSVIIVAMAAAYYALLIYPSLNIKV